MFLFRLEKHRFSLSKSSV